MREALSLRRILLLGASLAFSACDDDPQRPDPPGLPAAVESTAGGGQSALAGTVLPQSLVVRVTDAEGDPVPGVSVSWVVTAGGGSLFAAAVTTGPEGTASNQWTLGTAAGTQTVEARIVTPGGSFLTVVFQATAHPGAPAAITAVGSAARSGLAGLPLADSLAVRVTDAFGNPVPGSAVVWSVASGGGSITPPTATTDANGIARGRWELGARLDSVQVAHASAGLTLRQEFTAQAALPPTASIVKVGGDAQTGTVGSALPQPLQVEVRLPDGRPVVGASVVWTLDAGAGTLTPPAQRTGSDGRASTSWTLPTSAGSYLATATAEGSLSTTFTAQALPAGAARLVKVAGEGQSGPMRAPLPDSLAVQVVDGFGNGVPGVQVTWTVTVGAGSVSPPSGATGPDGVVRTAWTLGPPAGIQRVSAASPGLAAQVFTANGAAGPLAVVDISPDTLRMDAIGVTGRFTALRSDAFGNTRTDPLTWTSLDPAIATVDGTGLTTARANGGARIVASAGGIADTALALVQQVPSRVVIQPRSLTLTAPDTGRLVASVRDRRAVTIPGATVTWSSPNPAVATVNQSGVVTAVGLGSVYIFATSGTARDSVPVQVSDGLRAASVSAGGYHTCAVQADGDTYCWGSNRGRQLGSIAPNQSALPILLAGNAFATVSAGEAPAGINVTQGHSCGVTAGGQIRCWGVHEGGQLGYDDGGTPGADSPQCRFGPEYSALCYETPTAVGGGGWAQVSAGANHTCALTSAGAAYCWGENTHGQLGTTVPDSTCYRYESSPQPFACSGEPRQVAGGHTFSGISAGSEFTCALTSAGILYCWGRNDRGQLGTGNTTPSRVPVAAAFSGFTLVQVSAGGRHACALDTNRLAHCWGDNGSGQLGLGPAGIGGFYDEPSEVIFFEDEVGNLVAYTDISAGGGHTCARTTKSRVYCWGANGSGQVGNPSAGAATSFPLRVTGVYTYAQVSAGGAHTCAVAAGSSLLVCWGANQAGQLGAGAFSPATRITPEPVREP